MSAHVQIVIGAEEGVETEVFGRRGYPKQVAIAGPLLRLGEDAQVHRAILTDRPGGAPTPFAESESNPARCFENTNKCQSGAVQ